MAFHDIRKLVRFATKMPHAATTKCPHEYFIRSILARPFMRNMFNEENFFRENLSTEVPVYVYIYIYVYVQVYVSYLHFGPCKIRNTYLSV